MREGPVFRPEGSGDFSPTLPLGRPDAGPVLLGLLELVVAGLAERLDVVLVPEEIRVATVRDDVVTDQERSVRLDPAALGTLAGEEISGEDPKAKQLPALQVEPSAPRLLCLAVAVRIARDERSPRGDAVEPGWRSGEPTHGNRGSETRTARTPPIQFDIGRKPRAPAQLRPYPMQQNARHGGQPGGRTRRTGFVWVGDGDEA